MTAARIDELRSKFEENPRRYFAPLANEYRKAGDLTQAIALCREFLPNQPGHMSGHIVYGQALYEAGELDEARDVFETALDLDPENLIALRHLGDIARARGDLGGAKRWYERVLEADPRNDDIAAQLAALATQRRTPALPAVAIEAPAPVAAEAPTTAAMEAPPLVAEEAAPPWLPVAAIEATGADAVEGGDAEVSGAAMLAELETPPTAEELPWAVEPPASEPLVAPPVAEAPAEPSRLVDATATERLHELPVSPSADALTEALDAFATWEVGATAPAPSAIEPPDVRAEERPPVDAADAFEAGFFAPDWPTDLAAVGPRTPAAPTAAIDAVSPDDLAEPLSPAASAGALSGEAGIEASGADAERPVEPAATFLDDRQAWDEPPVTMEAVDVVSVVEPAAAAGGEVAWDLRGVERDGEPHADATPPLLTVEAALTAGEPDREIEPPQGFEPTQDDEGSTPAAWLVAMEVEASPVSDAPGAVLEGAVADDRTEVPFVLEVDAVVERTEELDVEVVLGAADDEAAAPAEPIVTETVAELYLQQGLPDRALAVYRQLAARAPDDTALRARVAELEADLVPAAPARTAGEWFAALAARRVTRGAPHDDGGARGAGELAALFGEGTDGADERAAAVWAQAFGAAATVRASSEDALFAAGADVTGGPGVATPPAGMVAAPALEAPTGAAAPVTGGFSFEQFFTPAAPPPARPAEEAPAPPAADLANFAAWLRGLAG